MKIKSMTILPNLLVIVAMKSQISPVMNLASNDGNKLNPVGMVENPVMLRSKYVAKISS